jgi:ATP-dependent DNA helicase DinG
LKNNTTFTKACANYFLPEGKLAQAIEGFAPRPSQVQLTEAIAQAMEQGTHLVAEAGTGTGKTYAYLVPALLSEMKTVISTGTKNLQDQLFKRDLPLVREALGKPVKVALLKGRDNYLCHYHIDRHLQNPALTQKEFYSLQKIRQKLASLKQGEKQELTDIDEHDSVFHYAVSTKDNCLNQECEFYKDCFLVKARRKAMDADIVVVNHHLLFADLTLKDEGLGELLPKVKAIILDEAHQVPDIASRFLSKHVSTRQIAQLADTVATSQLKELSDTPQLGVAAQALLATLPPIRALFGAPGQRGAVSGMLLKQWHEPVTALLAAMSELNRQLSAVSGRSKTFEQLSTEAASLFALADSLFCEASTTQIHWYEVHQQAVVIYHTPLVLADVLKPYLMDQHIAWIFTSATLAVEHDFSHFTEQLGLTNVRTLKLDSPFDYANQALIYIPRGLPDLKAANFLEAFMQACMKLINAAKGRTFILFTSHYALQQAAQLLRTADLPYPLFVQGEGSKDYLLSAFREAGNAILLGTQSFWEGVDVRGQALSCVIIDKLPFASPDDPILQARNATLKQQGKNPFAAYQLPQAVITLKQGSGRLIRDYQDKGVLMIADMRLLARDYGRVFMQSLPPKARTRDLEKVIAFLEGC